MYYFTYLSLVRRKKTTKGDHTLNFRSSSIKNIFIFYFAFFALSPLRCFSTNSLFFAMLLLHQTISHADGSISRLHKSISQLWLHLPQHTLRSLVVIVAASIIDRLFFEPLVCHLRKGIVRHLLALLFDAIYSLFYWPF